MNAQISTIYSIEEKRKGSLRRFQSQKPQIQHRFQYSRSNLLENEKTTTSCYIGCSDSR